MPTIIDMTGGLHPEVEDMFMGLDPVDTINDWQTTASGVGGLTIALVREEGTFIALTRNHAGELQQTAELPIPSGEAVFYAAADLSLHPDGLASTGIQKKQHNLCPI